MKIIEDPMKILASWMIFIDFPLRIGDHLDFLFPNDYHDSNTAFDRNPLYKQPREEQLFDVNGGFAILVLSVLEEEPRHSAVANYKLHVLLQGRPQVTHFTAIDLFVHSWACKLKDWPAKGQKVYCGGALPKEVADGSVWAPKEVPKMAASRVVSGEILSRSGSCREVCAAAGGSCLEGQVARSTCCRQVAKAENGPWIRDLDLGLALLGFKRHQR